MYDIITNELIEKTYLFCRKRISDSEEAKDISQEVILAALTAIRSGKQINDFYAWYWRVAKNKVADYLKSKQNQALPIESTTGLSIGFFEHMDKLISEEEINELNYSLSRLAAISREVVIRFYLKEQSVQQIAEQLNIPVGTVKRRLFQARQDIKERIVNMNKYGKSSYSMAQIRTSWGGDVYEPQKVFSGEIAKQICIVLRNEAMTINEIADEMGIAPIYLRQIIDDLVRVELIKKLPKEKYITNFCIFPANTYNKADYYAQKAFYDGGYPEKINDIILSLKDKITALDFYGNDFDYSYLMWLLYDRANWGFYDRGIMPMLGIENPSELNKFDEGRKYTVHGIFLLPEEEWEEYPFRSIGWSNSCDCYRTSEYGYVHYQNRFQGYPFDDYDKGIDRCRWVDGSNIGLLVALSENPEKELNPYEEEQASEFIRLGLIEKTDKGLKVMIPIFTQDVLDKIYYLLADELKDLAAEFAATVSEEYNRILLPYVRKDLMNNYRMSILPDALNQICAMFYYGIEIGKTLSIPEDYHRSAAGLQIIRQK